MSQSTMSVLTRSGKGKGAARQTRRDGFVPAIIYGAKKDPVKIKIDPRFILKGLHTGHFFSTIYDLTITDENGKTENEKVLPRDVQAHPITDLPIHVDFMRLEKGGTINVEIPVNFINEHDCPGLRAGGVLQIVREQIELICPTDNIPSEIIVDLSGLEIGDAIRYSGTQKPEGTEPAISDRDFMVATIAAPRALVEETDEEEVDDMETDDENQDEGDEK